MNLRRAFININRDECGNMEIKVIFKLPNSLETMIQNFNKNLKLSGIEREHNNKLIILKSREC